MADKYVEAGRLDKIEGLSYKRAQVLVEAGITLDNLREVDTNAIIQLIADSDEIEPGEEEVAGWKNQAEDILTLEAEDGQSDGDESGLPNGGEGGPPDGGDGGPPSGDDGDQPGGINRNLARLREQIQEVKDDPSELRGLADDLRQLAAEAEFPKLTKAVIGGNDGSGGAVPPPPGWPPTPNPGPGDSILIRDMRDGNLEAYRLLDDRRHLLRRKKKDQDGELEPISEQELIAAEIILGLQSPKLVIEALFKAVQDYQRNCNDQVPDHRDGHLPVIQSCNGEQIDEGVMALTAIYGIMRRENNVNPNSSEQHPDALALACYIFDAEGQNHDTVEYAFIRDELRDAGFREQDVCGDVNVRRQSRRFSNSLALAQAEYNRNRPLFHQVFAELRNQDTERAITAEKWAGVTSVLAVRGVQADDPLLPLRIREALAGQLDAGDGEFLSGIAIDLPDLEAETEVEIIQDNLHAMQAIYFAAMLDEANAFQVRDALMASFHQGLLPFGRGRSGDLLYRMHKEAPNRLSEFDRRNLYARSMGFAGGDAHGMVNRDFQMLWLRFVSNVSSFARQLSVDNLFKMDNPLRVRQEQVKKSGRDLAANLSLYGYGVTYFAATELQQQINEIIDLFSNDDVKGAYGARDMWGVIEQVSALELGGARDTIRYRTMAAAGAVIIRWLANNANDLADVGLGNVLDVAEIQRPRVRPLGTKPTVTPFDSDLVNACDRWLAVTGTPDQQVESYAMPVESPIVTSQPVRMPTVASDLLESVGLNGIGV